MSKKEIKQKMKKFGCMSKNCSGKNPNLTFVHVQKLLRQKFNYLSVDILIDELRKCIILCGDCCKRPHHIHKNIEYCQEFLLKTSYPPTKDKARRFWKKRLLIRESKRKAAKSNFRYRCTKCHLFVKKKECCGCKCKFANRRLRGIGWRA